MRMAMKRHAIWVQGQKPLHRIRNPWSRLVRQAKEDIGIQAMNTRVSHHLDSVSGHIVALDPANDPLDPSVRILHPDRGPVHPGGMKRFDPGQIDLIRVNLDRKFVASANGTAARIAAANSVIEWGCIEVGVPSPQCRRRSVTSSGKLRVKSTSSAYTVCKCASTDASDCVPCVRHAQNQQRRLQNGTWI